MAIALVLFTLVIMLYILFTDAFTILFRITGMTEEKARFQVTSLLTNSGFTTHESEMVVDSKIRRRLARMTMIFGYAFTATIVSSIVTVFFTFENTEIAESLYILAVLGVIIILFIVFRKVPFLRNQFDHLIEKIGTSLIYKENANAVLLLDDYREVVIARVILSVLPNCLEKNTVFTSGLKDNYGIMVIMKIDPDGNTSEIKADTMIDAGDEIIVVGKREEIVDAFINSPDILDKTKAVPFSPSKRRARKNSLKAEER